MDIKSLIKEIQKKKLDIDIKKINKAYFFAKKAHEGQKRKTGEDYILHPLRTAFILCDFNIDTNTFIACLLHDVLEDTKTTADQIKKEFGQDVLDIVKKLTKISKIEYQGARRYSENLKKTIIALSSDARIAFIKLADRLDNLKTINTFRPEKRRRKARESLDIYAPIANRFGMGWLKGEIEDLAFPVVYQKEYSWLMSQIKNKFKTRKAYLKRITPKIQKYLKKEKIKIIKIDYRAKRHFSLYQKLKKYDLDINKIHDLVAFRIIVPTIEDCYATLGIIHKYYNPLMGRIKDYIAVPKPNGYKSLHTTVFCDKGIVVEFQIRTEKMHREAEHGIAAHWYYSEKKGLTEYLKKIATRAPEKNVLWVKQFKEWQKEIKKADPKDLYNTLKVDLFKEKIFVFTTNGDVIELPEKSCAIDFAYAVHSDLGNHCSQAIVNGKIKALFSPLKNGDIISIKSDKKKSPDKDWINYVKTQKAKSQIRKFLNPKKTRKRDIIIKPVLNIQKKIMTALADRNKYQILVSGQDHISVVYAKCCNPHPGDKIIGYITKTKGITIHRKDCNAVKRFKKSNIVPVSWKKKA